MNTNKPLPFLQLVDEAFEGLELWYPVYPMKEAGARWIDEPVVTHGHLVSAKGPADLPGDMTARLALLKQESCHEAG